MKDAILRIEATRVERAETLYAKMADACLFVSPIEAEELDRRIEERKCFSATMGAEVDPSFDASDQKEFDLGFVGNMYTSANQDSLSLVVYEILPYLPNATLSVIGVCPDEVRAKYRDLPRVSFTGRVGDIREHLGRCRIMMAPFSYGSGIKTKILEAMGMGIPVVTNSIGLEGIAAIRGKDVLCADEPKRIAAEAKRLLENEEYKQEIALSGYKYVRDFHNWDKSIQSLGRCFDFACTSRAAKG